jgi:hypothetical protein
MCYQSKGGSQFTNINRLIRINPNLELVYSFVKYIPRSTLFLEFTVEHGAHGGVVVEALRYKPEGRGFDSRWRHWIFSLT